METCTILSKIKYGKAYSCATTNKLAGAPHWQRRKAKGVSENRRKVDGRQIQVGVSSFLWAREVVVVQYAGQPCVLRPLPFCPHSQLVILSTEKHTQIAHIIRS